MHSTTSTSLSVSSARALVGLFAQRALGVWLIVFAASVSQVGLAQTTVLLGTQTVQGSRDYNAGGQAEAFQVTATASGTLTKLTVYVDTSSAASTLIAGLYSDASGSPGTLLASGSLSGPVAAAWNAVTVTNANVTAGGKYWVAILGTGGTLRFRDVSSGSCSSQTNKNTGLSALPASWTPGSTYHDCPLSAYGTGSSTAQAPLLSVSSNTASFAMTVGGVDPSPLTVNVSNTGGGTLSFTAASDSSWLTVSPTSGSAPASLTISTSGVGLAVGTYTGHVTVTASGVQGSPQTVTATLTVSQIQVQSQPGDWLMVDHDQTRTGFASDETTLSPSNVGNLALSWTATLDGQITAQPLFVGGINVGGTTHDIVIASTSNNSLYALDATTGAVLWKRNFGAQPTNCVYASGFGLSGTTLIDRPRQRVYAVSGSGVFYSVSLIDGSIVGNTGAIVLNPATNNVWGGLNTWGNYVYFATGSNGCDSQPWQGTIYKVDVSGATPVLNNSVAVVPSLASTNNAGGGIWGYGGVSIDPANGNIYVTAAKDVNESTTLYAGRMIAYDSNLNVLGSYLPTDPATFPCSGAPCDLDFGSSPTVLTPPSCPQMVLGGKKNGNLYLFKTADLIASGSPTQILTINSAADSLGTGGAADPAYWPTGNMVFEGTAGTGGNGFAGGIVALNVTNSCTLTGAWSHALGGNDLPNSTVTIANGVAYIGVGSGGQVFAYNATNGTQLWQSASGLGNTFAAPMVAKGSLFVGSWNGFAATDGGAVRAYTLNANTFPTTLTVSPTTLSFSGTVGGANPATQDVTIGNSGNGTLSFTAQSDSNWLTVSPTSGTAPQTLVVGANTTNLPAGTLTGHITITASGAAQSPQTVTATLNLTSGGGGGGGSTVLLGDQTIESQADYNSAGVAEAFQATATTTGSASTITFYIDSTSNASQVVLGIYSDNGNGHPGTLLTQVAASQLTLGGWNTVSLPSAAITQGSSYWIAILGTSGTVRFRDRSRGGCSSETSGVNNLSSLPGTWTTGSVYTDCPISVFVSH